VFLKLNKTWTTSVSCIRPQAQALIDGPYGLGEVPEAMRQLRRREAQGKVVISLEGGD